MTGQALPSHTIKPWPVIRNAIVTFLDYARPHAVGILVEIDVTDAIVALRALQRELRIALSLHAFLIYCLVQTAAEIEGARTYRLGKRRLVTFEDVDISTPIDKRLPNGVRIPVGYIMRSAQRKTLAQVFWELRAAIKAKDLDQDPAVRMRRRFAAMPGPVRRLIAWRIMRDPFRLKQIHGTIGLSSVQSIGENVPAFPLVPTVHTLSAVVGMLCDRFRAAEDGAIERRRVLCVTISCDHDVMDGMPFARFTQRFNQLVGSAHGLDQAFADEIRALLAAPKAG